ARSLGVDDGRRKGWNELSAAAREWDGGENAMRAVNEVAPFEVRERAPVRIGNRMGRPEKSESRDLSPAVHTLFPINEAGGPQRDVSEAAGLMDDRGRRGHLEIEVANRLCPSCGTHTYRSACPDCGTHTEPHYECGDCGTVCEPDEAGRVECPRCEWEVTAATYQEVDVNEAYRSALETVGERESAFEICKGVQGLTSTNKTPEAIEKGILRAKNGVTSFKDGTVRYDMTDLPVTAVRPEELDVTADHFRELGYETDIDGDPLRHDDQLIELKVQDIVLSDGAAEHMLRTADFVDDLLAQFYDLPRFYEVNERDDLVGELVFGMAPHTSAATVGRVVGFTSAAVGYAHPYFHAAKRRNCFHPETKIWFEDETGSLRHDEIDDFVEAYLDRSEVEFDDFGTAVGELEGVDGDLQVPALTAEGDRVSRPVEAVSRHEAPDHMMRIRTTSGRSITVTPDHGIHVYDGERDEIVGTEARDLDTTDELVVPDSIGSDEADPNPQRFDLLAEFIRSDAIPTDRLMIKGLDKDRLYGLFEDVFADDWDGKFYPLQSMTEVFGTNKKTLSNYLYRQSFPASYLQRCFSSIDDLLGFVPEDVTLGMKRDRTEIDRIVDLNGRVATLLGYYAAEGFAREQETPKGTIHQTTVCGTEAEAREFFLDVLRDEFGVDPYEENHAKITTSGRLLRAFFDSVLDAGAHAHTKRVPDPMFDASEDIVGAYLSGYFSGDGVVDRRSLRITATTVSEELREDLLALLRRLGIHATVDRPERVRLHEKFPDFYDESDMRLNAQTYVIAVSSQEAVRFAEAAGFHLSRKADLLAENVSSVEPYVPRVSDGGSGEYLVEAVDEIEIVESDFEHVYCLTVEDTHSLVANDLSVDQCDGDEDCVMLLMDGLLNFSKEFLPNQRGGRMDAPLVMSSRIDPSEIDDEAHNMDIVRQYPLEFYEATQEMADPETVEDLIQLGEDTLGTDDEYRGFDHTHDTTDIAMGPDLSAYKTLGDMMEKMNAQLELARKTRAVDETDVAERVIEYHFLPDIIGNLRAFSRQETRCLDCGEKYRRVPLTGDCRECGGRVNLTVHEGSVSKYVDTAIAVAEKFDCRPYTKQRLYVLEEALESIFEDDTNKQSGIADFM
ncbi:LAGLIDADG family homing endonuclease, partial [Halorubrum tibetense]